MLVLLGDTAPAAAAESKAVMALETRLAQASMSDVEQREPHAIYHPMTLEALHAMAPHLDVAQMLPELNIPQIDSLNVGMPEFLKAVDREMANTSLADWKAYLRWQLLDAYAPYLSAPFVSEDFRMTAELTGAEQLQERWLRVLKAEDDALGFAIGQLYVARKFPTAWKEAAAAVVGRIRQALHDDLGTLPWMSPATRAAAQQKLALMQLRIGYPDQWRDYAGLAIDSGPFVLNVMRANAFEVQRQLAKIGRPVDRSEWYMTPQTVNAYYDPSMNSLTVPAGILQPPYFDPNFSDAVNFGATGVTIGHEMTHGFDDEGAQFDGYGNLKNWWAPAGPREISRRHAVHRRAILAFNGGRRNARAGSAGHRRGDRRSRRSGARMACVACIVAGRACPPGGGGGVHAGPAVLHCLCPFMGKRKPPETGRENGYDRSSPAGGISHQRFAREQPRFSDRLRDFGPESDGQSSPLHYLVRFDSSRSLSPSRSRTGVSAL